MPKSRNRKKKKSTPNQSNRFSSEKPMQKIEKKGLAPDPIKMQYFEVGFKGLEDTTFEQRIDAIRKIGRNAANEFQEKYKAIPTWFTQYDQIHILSFCFYYFMTSVAGYDEEAVTGELDFPPYYLELLQAFSLTLPRKYSASPFSYDVEKFKKELKEIFELNKFKLFDLPDNVSDISDIYRHQLKANMIMHTTAVRNWSYEHKMEKVTLDLAREIKDAFMAVYNFNPEDFLKVLYKMRKEVENRMNIHRVKMINIVQCKNYNQMVDMYESCFFVKKEADRESLWQMMGKNLQNLKGMYLMHSDMFLPEILSFDYVTLERYSDGSIPAEKFKEIIGNISLCFGDLAENNSEYFLLNNPVHEKPFIKIGDEGIFSSLWMVMTHLSIGILEKFCAEDEKLREKYNDARAEYLEDELTTLFRSAFPMAQIFRGSKWKGKDGKEYENDLLVIIDAFALVIEAKSGQVSPPAKRGGDRLFKTLKKLIEEPSEQALRFIEFLKENPTNLSLSVKKGSNNNFDAGLVKYFVPLGVTLSFLGATCANLKQLIKTGITDKSVEELAPSINLTDLQIVFELLPLTAEKIHYLQRRRELEANIEYVGDELDLLAWYFDNAFDFDEKEFGMFNISMKSKELNNYIIGSAIGEEVVKPELKMLTWWRDILSRLEQKHTQGWLEASYVLLNISFDGQEVFERDVKELKKRILAGKVDYIHNWTILCSSEDERQFSIAAYYYPDGDLEMRNNFIADIFNEKAMSNAKGKIVIGMNKDFNHYPYSVLASLLSPELFDNRYLKMVRLAQ